MAAVYSDFSLLRNLTGLTHGFMISNDSYFIPDALTINESMAPSSGVRVQVLPKNSPVAFGQQQVTFELQQQLPEVTTMILEVTVSPITATGATYVRIVDFFPLWFQQNITYRDPNFGPLWITW